MLTKTQLNADKLLNYYFCDEETIQSIKESKSISEDDREQLVNYIRLKNKNIEIKCSHNVNLVSIGCNCYPHTMGIRLGYKPSKWISKKERTFFDLGVTGIDNIIKILPPTNTDYELVDDFDPTGKWFVSKEFNFKWNHDFVNENKTKEQNIKDINGILNLRLKETRQNLSNGNCLAVSLIFKKAEEFEHILTLRKIIEDYNQTNHLLILDPENLLNFGNELLNNNISYNNTKYPTVNGSRFVWYSPESYLTREGFSYYNDVSSYINQVIDKHFEKQNLSELWNIVYEKTRTSDNFKKLLLEFQK